MPAEAQEKKQLENIQSDKPRIGVYICHCGGNISDVVDVQKLAEQIEKIPEVKVARTNMFMCSDPGQEMILEDLRKENLYGVVVASCSPKLHELTFRNALKRGDHNPFLYEHANIREQVSWVHHDDPGKATEKAIRLVSAAVAKAVRLQPLEPIRVDAYSHAVVIGGGISGLTAAQRLSKQGIGVTLVEQSPFLGGHTAQLDRIYPTEERAEDLLVELVTEVVHAPNITVLTQAEVVSSKGTIGDFLVQVRRKTEVASSNTGPVDKRVVFLPFEGCAVCSDWGSAEEDNREIKAGIVVMATGFKNYMPQQGEYKYGESPQVITLPDLIKLLSVDSSNGGKLEVQGRPVRDVALIHCVGSRQVDGIHEPQPDGKVNDYCSRVCCTATLQAANAIKDRFPDVNVYEYYQDIRTYGRGHEKYYEDASNKGVLFFRFTADSPPVVEKAAPETGHPLKIRVKDTLTFGEEIEALVDLVVLSVGMMPNEISDLVDVFKLPMGTDRFLQEVHPKLRPVEMSVNGLLLAGTAQGPRDISESCASATAAASKAAITLGKGYVELEPFVAQVDTALCDGCGLCLEECGYEAALMLTNVEVNGRKEQKALVNPALCMGCGSCAAVCSRRAINVNGWTLDQFEAMVDAIAAQ
ncbi:MAG TPA: CoB--CoM heterodisulfide reductase iron-sulfur subunit A family protein [Desulfomonilaceae bacterium]|nr:CoB--CoM heterodisulfide reductase iron-sulfur subunit A family protein [Desulfomonilaceae bacterium]